MRLGCIGREPGNQAPRAGTRRGPVVACRSTLFMFGSSQHRGSTSELAMTNVSQQPDMEERHPRRLAGVDVDQAGIYSRAGRGASAMGGLEAMHDGLLPRNLWPKHCQSRGLAHATWHVAARTIVNLAPFSRHDTGLHGRL